MNRQERQALQDFLHELAQARVQNKDQEAHAMISRAIERQPDAPYLLVQRALLQEQALSNAQQHIMALQRELDATRSSRSGGFLDSIAQWGRGNSFMRRASGRPQGSPYGYGTPQDYYAMPMARPGLMNGGMGNFLGSMAGVAAGVAAGSFLFHGIDHLLHHNDGHDMASQDFADTPNDQGQANQFLGDQGWESSGLSEDAGIDDIGSWEGDTGMGGDNGDFL